MATTDTKQQLKDLFRELFQLNNTDLDFGIYRILNIKAKEVEAFIEKDIDAKIESVKDKIIDRQSGDIKAELEEVKAKLKKDFKVDFQKEGDLEAKVGQFGQLELFMEPFNRFKTAKDKLDNLRVSEDTEKSIYNELYRFFERYYEGGDFISKPRAGKNNYMIPYEGEEVKLYWANYDQYYIKTGDNFKNYLFNNQSSDPKLFTQVEFRILDAETAINNNKEEKGRLFVPAEEPFEWVTEERKLLVKFYYRVPNSEEKKAWGEKQSVKTENKGINQKLAALVIDAGKNIGDAELLLFLSKTRPNSKGEAIPLFFYHLERYTTVNKFDYFIHKDLKGFLRRELDFFLKTDVMSIAFLDPTWKEQEVQEAIKNNVLKASAIRDVALVVIDFMSELEEFQKRLFEKKKFVVESHYCMTLDRIPESVYVEVVKHIITDIDKKQIKEWIDLKFITGNELDPKKTKDNKEDEFTDAKAYLKANDKLVIDTKNLPDELKWQLLAAFENLDEITDGLLINSENFQGLQLIQSKFKGKIKTTYIDPPYNKDSDDFAYKDSFKHSSWLSLLYDRVKVGKGLLDPLGNFFMSIDDVELINGNQILNKIFNLENMVEIFSWVKTESPSNLSNKSKKGIEYVLCYEKQKNGERYQGLKKENPNDNPLLKSNNSVKKLVFPKDKVSCTLKEDFLFKAGTYGTKVNTVVLKNDVWYRDRKFESDLELEGKFIWLQETLNEWITKDTKIIFKGKSLAPRYDKTEYAPEVPSNLIDKTDGVETYDDAKTDLNNLGFKDAFKYPKPVSLLTYLLNFNLNYNDIALDYFAGTGTTGHAVINLNRLDEGNRKYILIEMGNYFINVTKPRIIKAIYSDNWKDGIPIDLTSGVKHVFQYIKLEQYEDTLNNIEIHTTAPQLNFLDNIRYQLIYGTRGSDSLINLDKFTKPFDYTMKIVQQNEPKEGTNIDLVTTFNFLIGIEVLQYVLAENNGLDYKIVIGKKGMQHYIIIWRNFDEDTIDLKTEKEFITQQAWYNTTAFVYCNGDNAFSAHPIEPEFIRLMNEPLL